MGLDERLGRRRGEKGARGFFLEGGGVYRRKSKRYSMKRIMSPCGYDKRLRSRDRHVSFVSVLYMQVHGRSWGSRTRNRVNTFQSNFCILLWVSFAHVSYRQTLNFQKRYTATQVDEFTQSRALFGVHRFNVNSLTLYCLRTWPMSSSSTPAFRSARAGEAPVGGGTST